MAGPVSEPAANTHSYFIGGKKENTFLFTFVFFVFFKPACLTLTHWTFDFLSMNAEHKKSKCCFGYFGNRTMASCAMSHCKVLKEKKKEKKKSFPSSFGPFLQSMNVRHLPPATSRGPFFFFSSCMASVNSFPPFFSRALPANRGQRW